MSGLPSGTGGLSCPVGALGTLAPPPLVGITRRGRPSTSSDRACRCSRRCGGTDGGGCTGDLIAGLTVWAVLVPEALAYASIAGVSPVVGLYAAPPALVLYAAFGSSRHLVTGPMAATAALSAAAVADLVTGGRGRPRALRRLHRRPGPHDRRPGPAGRAPAAGLPGQLHLRAGAQGLHHRAGPDHHRRPAPQAVRGREGRGRLLRTGPGTSSPPSATPSGAPCPSASSRWPIVLVLRRVAPAVPGSLVAVVLGVLAGAAVRPRRQGGRHRRPHRQRAARRSACPTASASRLPARPPPPPSGSCSSASPRARRGQDLRHASHYEIDANRELIGLGAANIGSGLCSGMVVNGSLSKTAVNGVGRRPLAALGARRRRADGHHAAVPHRALRGAPRGDARRRRHRRPHRAGRLPRPRRAVPPLHRAASAHLRPRGPTRLHRRRSRRCSVSWCSTPCPGCSSGSPSRCCSSSTASSKPHVAELGRVPGTPGQYADRDATPRTRRRPGVVVIRVEGGLFFANADAVRRALRADAARPGTTAIVLDAESVPFVDVTAVRMLRRARRHPPGLGRPLRPRPRHRSGPRMSSTKRSGPPSIPLYPTVQAAVEAMSG